MKNKLMLVLIFFIFLFSIVTVSAIDDTNDTSVNNGDILSVNNGETIYDDMYSVSQDENDSILTENEEIKLSENEHEALKDLNSSHYGYWTWSKEISCINFTDLSKNGVTDILLNYYALERYNESFVKSFILDAGEYGIKTHIWAQIFYEGSWVRPIDRAGNVNYAFFDNKTAELEYYAGIEGVAGIHYDYIRFSGSERYDNTAWQNPGGKEAITYFIKQSSEAIRKINPNIIISAALMPEISMLEEVYGVDYSEVTKYFDVVMPMAYRGNFNEDSAWVYNVTKYFVDNSQGSVVWTGLQAYVDDDHMDNCLPLVQLNNDTINALDAGAKGVMIFKTNSSKNIDFNNLTVDENQLSSFEYLYYLLSSTVDTLDLENDFAFNETTDNEFIDGIEIYKDDITINGNNHVIDGKNLAKIFKIPGDHVTLKNIQFKNAFTNDTGAVAYIEGDNVEIINCSFIDNFAEYEAAAVFLIGEYGSIQNCTFINNTAKYTGAVLLRSTNGQIINSYFENNTAEISAAAIGLATRRDNIIQNCVFINNAAYNEGGAAIFVNKALNLKIINSTFLDNYAHYNGGGIFWSYGSDGSIINSTFINNTATEKGGAIYHIGDKITLADNLFKDNAAVNGSAIYLNNGTENVLSKNIIISNDFYMNNIDNSDIMDSIILDKIISNNSTASFTNNWFGNTKNNYNESLNEYADNWLYLNASADKTMIGEDVPIEFYFDQFNNSKSFDLPEITLKLDADNLVLDNDTVSIDGSVNSHVTDYGAYVNASFENITLKYELPIADINIFADDMTKYYGDSQRFIVSVLDSKSNPISNKTVYLSINGKKYTKITDKNGSASIGINLNSGEYNMTTAVDNITVYSTVTVLSTIDADNLVKVFKNESQYYALFKDLKGNPFTDANVTFNINGITYFKTTDKNGTAKLNINLSPGKYIITSQNPLTGEMHSNNITVLSRICENTDLVKYYRNDSQYSVRILGDDANPVGAGEVVTFNINGVLYNRTTNESGYATLNINLGPGYYVITAEYKSCKVSNNIIVKPVLFASDLDMSYNDGSKFTASLLDGQGRSYANQNIKFNINGVFYDKTTDINGEAKLNINLLPGQYIITSSYNGYNAANKVTIS